MIDIPKAPKLHYSTWGIGLYSEHWLTSANCWMYGVIKLVEKNIQKTKNNEIIKLFEKLSASDLMFVYDDPSQQDLSRKVFLQYLVDILRRLTFVHRETVACFPVDPFQSIFVYVTMDSPLDNPNFKIDKISDHDGSITKRVTLESHSEVAEGIYIYYQHFMVYPGKCYQVSVSSSSSKITIRSPDYGMPIYIGDSFNTSPKYRQPDTNQKLNKIWGDKESIPYHTGLESDVIRSRTVCTESQINSILKGKKVAVYKYNKEVYSLIQLPDLLGFTIDLVIDDSYDSDNGLEYSISKRNDLPVVKDINKIEDYTFNAVIITCSLNYETEIIYLKKLVEIAAKNNFPLVSLYGDVLEYNIFDNITVSFGKFYKVGFDGDYKNDSIKSIYRKKKAPVLSVFGTDSVQGKFTTQVLLRESLEKWGKVFHWSTEPTGPLIGAGIGYSRCYGEQSDEQLKMRERKVLEEVQIASDLVITGGQNSITFEVFDGCKENNASTSIYEKFLPSYIILTISVDTPLQMIVEAVEYIKNLERRFNNKSRVLAFSIMSGRKVHGSRWTETYFLPVDEYFVENKKNEVSKEFNIPVFCLPDELSELSRLTQKICMTDE